MFIHDSQYSVLSFNHSASVIAIDDQQSLITFYTGQRECHISQHVVLLHDDGGKVSLIAELDEYTGNPIIFKKPDGSYSLIYSEFANTRVFPIYHWWQYCTIWQQDILNLNKSGKVKLSPKRQIIVKDPIGIEDELEPGIGYVPRCNLLSYQGELLLPLYREHSKAYGVVLASVDGNDWEWRGNIGDGNIAAIQPTIWESENKLKCLMRNFDVRGNGHRNALYSESVDNGETWSRPKASSFLNYNNSVFTLEYNKIPFVIWNFDPSGRENLTLSATINNKNIKLATIDGYGSYPNACIQGNYLNVVYTGKSNPYKIPNSRYVIKHKRYHLPTLARNAKLIANSDN